MAVFQFAYDVPQRSIKTAIADRDTDIKLESSRRNNENSPDSRDSRVKRQD